MFTKLLVSAMPLVPGPIMRRLAGRYIAGERLEDALRKLGELRAQGFTGIFDILGEGSNTEAHARAAAAAYASGAEALSEAGLDAYISIKPSHLGLKPGIEEELPFELYSSLATRCAEQGRLVRVEMEDHPTTDATLRLFGRLRERFDNVGLVLQSRLFRTPDDIDDLPPGPLDVRMVKGIYLEPAEIAHTEPREISDAFVSQTRQLFQRGARVRFATHDEALGERLLALVRELDVPRERYEFQVLLGVQEHLWTRWRGAGHPVRVYVPFGPEWRSYSQRRLRKNPKLAAAVIRDLIGVGK